MSAWAMEENEILAVLWPRHPIEQVLAALPARTLDSIREHARVRRIRRYWRGAKVPFTQLRSHSLFQQLRRERLARNIGLAGFAKQLGYDRRTVERWELGRQVPPWRALQDWCDALDHEVVIRRKPPAAAGVRRNAA